MPEIPPRLITYCTNIHPGESWPETFAALRRYIPPVKAAVSPDQPFPVGLRLSCRAAVELAGANREAFRLWLEEQDCFVPTLNGFPYGTFHGRPVKAQVYRPDWCSPLRADYTVRLADLLAGWLPAGVTGSISTVPLGCKGDVDWPDLSAMRPHLEAVLARLARIHADQGKMIVLALEPEPGCLLETTADVCRFFAESGLNPALLGYLGLCYDCCHQAVEFEEPAASWRRLAGAGIPIAKVQVSSALRVGGGAAGQLRAFVEPHYLHQVVVCQSDGTLHRYADLPEALARHRLDRSDEWRCHFHVPIFRDDFEGAGTTRGFLEEILGMVEGRVLLEVETYTWEVLPGPMRGESVTGAVIREINWLKGQLRV